MHGGPPIDDAYCAIGYVAVTYDGVGQTRTNAVTSGGHGICTLTRQNPPASSAVAVQVIYTVEDDTVQATNTVSFDMNEGTGLAQAAYRRHDENKALNTRWKQQRRVPSLSAFNIVSPT